MFVVIIHGCKFMIAISQSQVKTGRYCSLPHCVDVVWWQQPNIYTLILILLMHINTDILICVNTYYTHYIYIAKGILYIYIYIMFTVQLLQVGDKHARRRNNIVLGTLNHGRRFFFSLYAFISSLVQSRPKEKERSGPPLLYNIQLN